MQECWDKDPNARLTAGNVYYKINELYASSPQQQQQESLWMSHAPSSSLSTTDPIHNSKPILFQEHSQFNPPPCYSLVLGESRHVPPNSYPLPSFADASTSSSLYSIKSVMGVRLVGDTNGSTASSEIELDIPTNADSGIQTARIHTINLRMDGAPSHRNHGDPPEGGGAVDNPIAMYTSSFCNKSAISSQQSPMIILQQISNQLSTITNETRLAIISIITKQI